MANNAPIRSYKTAINLDPPSIKELSNFNREPSYISIFSDL